MKKRQLSVFEYEKEFLRLSKYYPALIATEEEKCKRFEQGLNSELKMYLVAHQFTEFSKLVKAVTRLEQEKRQEQGKQQQKRGFTGEQSGQKRFQDSQTSMGFSHRPDRGGFSRGSFQRQPGTGSSASVGFPRSSILPECIHCGKRHGGVCRRLMGTCLKCGAVDHQVKDCPETRAIMGPTSVGIVSRVQSGQRSVGSGQRTGRGGRLEVVAPRGSEANIRVQPTAPARTYAVRAREQQ